MGKLLQVRTLLIVFILLLGLPLCGLADEAGVQGVKDDNRLCFDLYLYLWATNLDGNVSIGSHTAHPHIRFYDIIDDLKMGASGTLKISKGDWFLFNDFLYVDISHKTSVNIAIIPGASIDAKLDTRLLMNMLAGGRQWQRPFPWSLFAGIRYFYGKVRLDATESLGTANQEAVVEKSKGWVTPTIGAAMNLPFNDKLSFNLITDIGAGDRSFNWEVIPTFCWKLSDTFTAEIGYRLLDIWHRKGSFKIDTLVHGMIIGTKITF